IVPVLTATPPIFPYPSTTHTFFPSLAPWIAAFCPAGPEPMTTRSNRLMGAGYQVRALSVLSKQLSAVPTRQHPEERLDVRVGPRVPIVVEVAPDAAQAAVPSE